MISVIEHNPGTNQISIAPEYIAQGRGLIEIGGTGNVVSIGKPHGVGQVTMRLSGGNTLRIGEYTIKNEFMLTFACEGGMIEIEEWASFNVRCSINMHEPATIKVGGHSLIAPDVHIACSEVHKILDLRSKKRLNPPADITIGSRVWLAGEVSVWGGADIGSGSVVGYRSFVNSKFPPNCLVAGNPARVLRKGIYWEP